ncbi:MAG: hypothetical protein K6T29_11030, partial [Peptococcaceae bacterium]|nr:hypothetical protein [Peptococcaceae bacterium]
MSGKSIAWASISSSFIGALARWSFFLALAGASLALLLAFVWLRGLNGYGIAGLFLTGAGMAPAFRVPFALTPVPALLAFLLALVLVLSGTL